jgi:molecular chaperone DnaJ
MDAYTLLGVAPGVDARGLKRAFRKLAMRWHPDRNPDPVAIEHFKMLRAAYDSLLSALEAPPEEAGEAEAEPDAAPARPEPKRGADRRQDLPLSVDEAFLGCEKIIEVIDEGVCTGCEGSGEEVLLSSRLCGHCHGSGKLRSRKGLTACGECAGRGYVNKQACRECGGSGRGRVLRRLRARVPAGLVQGDELRLVGEGEAPPDPDGVAGDLRLRVLIEPHPLYGVEGRDLVVDRPLSALRLLSGGEIRVPLPGGSRTIAFEAGGACACELRLEGAGFPARGGRPAGALVVRLRPVLPEGGDSRVRELAALLDAELSTDLARHLPEVASWEARWL